MERSTGLGVSAGALILPLRARVERMRGVEFADFDRLLFFGMGTVARIAGDCFFRDGRSPASSSLEDAVRLVLDRADEVDGCGGRTDC